MTSVGYLGNQLNKVPRRLYINQIQNTNVVRAKFTSKINAKYQRDKYSPNTSNNIIAFDIVANQSATNLFIDYLTYLQHCINNEINF